MEKHLGRSQQAVLDFVLAQDHPVDAVEVGLSLYEKTSNGAHLRTFWSKDHNSRCWAGKVLNLLVRRGYLQRCEKKGYYEPVPPAEWSPHK
jgi:hypothetical protein